MRGEKCRYHIGSMSVEGSPPRARGEGAVAAGRAFLHRITPACAGRRKTGWWKTLWRRDHPRVRGEKLYRAASASMIRGSPPRARGEARCASVAGRALRITPACAGRSRRSSTRRARTTDHPRVCGEKSCADTSKKEPSGSPPRVRGEGVSLGDVPRVQRITPACAGRSSMSA